MATQTAPIRDAIPGADGSTEFHVHIALFSRVDELHEENLPIDLYTCSNSLEEMIRQLCVTNAANELAHALKEHYDNPAWGHTGRN